MAIQPFKLERYFAQHEFSAPYLLSSSDIDALTMPELLELASDERRHQWDTLKFSYTESQGHPDLLSLISQSYEHVPPQQVIEVVPEEGIFIAMNTLLSEGDHIIVMHPIYQSLYEIAKSKGVEISYWQPSGQWEFDIDALANLCSHLPDTTMLVVNTPHNPTGMHFNHDEWQQLIDFARAHDLWLFSDEMYRCSEYKISDRLPAVCDAYEKGVSLSGLSKSFALPGLRVGWLATQSEEAMQKFITLKDYTTICSSAPSELLAIIALEAQEKILERNMAILETNLTILDQFFEDYKDYFRWQRPLAGTIALVEYIGGESIAQLADDLIKKGVMIVPSAVFDYEGNFFRLGFGRRNMSQILEILADHITDTS